MTHEKQAIAKLFFSATIPSTVILKWISAEGVNLLNLGGGGKLGNINVEYIPTTKTFHSCNIPTMEYSQLYLKPAQTFVRSDIETIFADLVHPMATTATTSESRTLISSAMYKEDCQDN